VDLATKLKQENLASSLRARPTPQMQPAAPAKPDMARMMVSPPTELNPTKQLTKRMGIGGSEGLKTPEGYIYDAIGAGNWF
jgi:hypothetical protein